MTAFIETRQVRKIYKTPAGDFTALKGIDLQVNQGEFVAVIGKSGSGKSTLINVLAGIDRPSSGEIYVGETAVHKLSEAQMAAWRGRNLGIIFQFFQLLPTLTVIENVMLPMDLNNTLAPRHRREHAMHLLDLVEMTQQADKLPSAVSGGQQQRVAIARALANNPPLIIADEPTGNLDSKTAEKIFLLFEGLVSAGKTILMVTHDDDLAKRASRTIMIADGEVVNEHLLKALATLNQDQVVEVKRKVTPHVYPPGAVIVEQGTVGSEFFIILDGEVEVFVRQPDGSNLFVDRLSSGQYFGEMALMGNGLRRGTVKANPHSEVAVAALDRASFDHLVADSRALREEIGEQITARLAQIQVRAEEEKRFHDKLREVEDRLTALQMAEEGGHGGN